MTYRQRLPLLLGLLGVVWALGLAWVMSGVVLAAGLYNDAPTPVNSTPRNGHVFYLRLNTLAGENRTANINAYFSTGSSVNWDAQYIELTPDHLDAPPEFKTCNKSDTGMTFAEKNRFIKVTVNNGSTPREYYIDYDRACSEKAGYNAEGVNNSNALFAKYRVTKPASTDALTDRYLVTLTIEYNLHAPTGTATNQDLNAFKFRVYSPDNNTKIGPSGGSYPIVGSWKSRDEYTTGIKLPFGMCDRNSNREQIGVQDADNATVPNDHFGARKVRFRVVDVTDPDNPIQVGWQGGTNGSPDSPETKLDGQTDWFTPVDNLEEDKGRSAKAYVYVKIIKGHKYEMVINGIAPANTIVVNLPGAIIAGDPQICTPWALQPNTALNNPALEVGGNPDTATWTHTVRNNVGAASPGPDIVRWRVMQQIDTATPSQKGSGFVPALNGAGSSYTAFGTYSFRARTAADIGKQICQWIEITPYKGGQTASDPVWKASSRQCARVMPRPDRRVNLQAVVPNGGSTETLSTANFTGYIQVSGFPNVNEGNGDGTWGYSEYASQVTPTRAPATKTTEGVGGTQYKTDYSCPLFWTPSNPTWSTTCTGPTQTTYSCPSGGTLSGSTCAYNYGAAVSYSCPGGGTYQGNGTCYKTYSGKTTAKSCTDAGHNWSGYCWDSFTATASYSCPSGGILWGTTCFNNYPATVVSTTTPTQPATMTQYYNYYCTETRTWTGWTTSSVDWCRDYYTCPAGSAGSGWANNASEITCEAWICQYGAAPYDDRIYTTRPACEYRCLSTGGARPYRARNVKNTTGTGDLRCFVQPSFSLTCYWDTGDRRTVTVNSDGRYCDTVTSKPAGAVGTVVCAVLTPEMPNAWSPANPQPGMIYSPATGVRQVTVWGWSTTSQRGCYDAVGYPYLKVYGGDVRVGGGITDANGTCRTGDATIRTRNQGPTGFAGSGAQFAAIASGFISEFVSGQYNDLATNPSPGNAPTRLSFANNAGGGMYGGGFGSAGACTDYLSGLPTDTENLPAGGGNGPTEIDGKNLGPNQELTQHVKGDAYITGDITYEGNWTSAAKIPSYQLIVEGDIYIDNNVVQLDGLYAAIAGGGSGGHIYTCSFVSRSPLRVVKPTNTFLSGSNNCKSQLVINGALAAKQVHFWRDCGSLRWSATESPERTTYSGGNNEQNCKDSNHAAEIINFSPEIWIRSSTGSGSNKYDSISSLPPIL